MSDEIRFYRAVGPHGFLSNLYPCSVTVLVPREDVIGKTFWTSEAAYQYRKPRRLDVADWIISAPKPHLVAAAAHALLSFDVREDWNTVKVAWMRTVVQAKFVQNPALREALLATGAASLIEESKTDAFWGAGKKGNGQNMLGRILMDLREWMR